MPKLRTANNFKAKHEGNVKASIGVLSLNGVGAASITNHWLVQASALKSRYSMFNARDTVNAGAMRVSLKHHCWDVGTGYFTAIRDKRFEIQAGYGRGGGSSFDPPPSGGDPGYNGKLTSRIINAKYHLFYLQPTFSVQANERAYMALVCRFTLAKYYEYQDNWPDKTFNRSRPVPFIEPSVDLRWNFDRSPVYFFLNAGLVGKMVQSSKHDFWSAELQIGLGVHINQHLVITDNP